MTLVELLGCVLITFGPPAALFILTVAKHPLRVILLMASAFFWLAALLFSSLIWYAASPLKETYIFGLLFSVAFQEVFRMLFYLLLRKARKGLEIVSNRGNEQRQPLNLLTLYYVCGLGYGIVSGAFATVNIYRDLSGPGTIGIDGDSQYFFIISAFMSLAFIIMHTFWGVIFMGSLDSQIRWRQVTGVVGVVCSHILVSSLTILNQRSGDDKAPLYYVTITFSYITALAMGIWAYNIVGGSGRSLQHLVHPPAANEQ